jgi:hypothetical protein
MVPRGFLREYSGLVAFVIRVVDLTVPLITFLLAFFIKYGYGQIIPAFYFYPLIAAFIFQAFLFAYFPIGISRPGGVCNGGSQYTHAGLNFRFRELGNTLRGD